MIQLSDGDISILRAALADAIKFQRSIAESEVSGWTDEQGENYLQAQARADIFSKMLEKLKRRIRARARQQ